MEGRFRREIGTPQGGAKPAFIPNINKVERDGEKQCG